MATIIRRMGKTKDGHEFVDFHLDNGILFRALEKNNKWHVYQCVPFNEPLELDEWDSKNSAVRYALIRANDKLEGM